MKIIAETNNSYIVEVTESELNKITGLDRHSYTNDRYKCNQVIEVIKTWNYLSLLLEKKDELIKQATTLRSMANLIESVPLPTIKTLDEELKSHESH